MLLRSASTPLLNSSSWVSHPAAASCDQLLSVNTHHPPSPSISSSCSLLSSSASSSSSSSSSASSRPRSCMLARAQSEGDLSKFQLAEVPKRRISSTFSNSGPLPSFSLEEEVDMEPEMDPSSPRSSPIIMQRRLLTSSGLDAGALMMQLAEGSLMENGYCAAASDEDDSEPAAAARGRNSLQLVDDDGCAGGGGRGGKMCGGGRGADNGDDEGFDLSDGADNKYGDSLDAYYARMVKADPRNPLVLGNYAKFLKEVRGDLDEAQVYCERAILAAAAAAGGVDAGVLSLYADIIWQTSKDADRAETYFNQALQVAPDDCYVAASYAHFLWDAEEEEEEEEETITSHHHQHPSSALSQHGRRTPPLPPPQPIATPS